MEKTIKASILEALYELIESRREADPQASYVAFRLRQGVERIAQKLGEEAVETVISAVRGNRQEIVQESADLLFHLLILWAKTGVYPADVFAELESRRGHSGLDEKRDRVKE